MNHKDCMDSESVVTNRPNIVFICTDQLSADALSCAGNVNVHTPAIDRLAERGIRFTNCYASFPLCGPSRAAMMTGRPNHEIGCMDNEHGIPDGCRGQTLGELLKAEGYTCAYGGKWHVPTLSLPKDDSYGFEVLCGFNDRDLPKACDAFFHREHDKPFFLVASFDNPHNICEHGRDQLMPWLDVDSDAYPVNAYPNLPANFNAGPYEPQAVTRYALDSPEVVHRQAYSPERWRKYRHTYFRLVEHVDKQVGQILESLTRAGLEENTVIIFASDHGEMCGSHQLSQKTVLYEESVKVPLIVSCPDTVNAGETDDRLASIGLDLLPTICDWAGVSIPEGLLGQSLRPATLGNRQCDCRDHLVCQTRLAHRQEARMVRTARYKYICHTWGQNREQLFDLLSDPHEQVNLAVEYRTLDILNEHRQLLADWCMNQKDPFATHYTRPHCATIPGLGRVAISETHVDVVMC